MGNLVESEEIVAFIFGRKGSKGVPGKNTRILDNVPMNNYSINSAINSKYVSNVYVSSDDDDIIKEARNAGAEIIIRPPELAKDKSLLEDSIVHAYNHVLQERKVKPSIIVILMCNVATINSDTIDKSIEVLINTPRADSIVTTTKMNMYSPLRARKINSEGFLEPFVDFSCFGNEDDLSCDRDSQGHVYFANMSHSIVRSKCIENIEDGLLPQKWMGHNILSYEQSFGCDIDAEWQFAASKWWLDESS